MLLYVYYNYYIMLNVKLSEEADPKEGRMWVTLRGDEQWGTDLKKNDSEVAL